MELRPRMVSKSVTIAAPHQGSQQTLPIDPYLKLDKQGKQTLFFVSLINRIYAIIEQIFLTV
ncbi:hypothetical protein NIES30_23745 [Phormidium tenue NIES-30]|uniref:Uncharacterized protein n=1 Tax=Phormidium tenue NIES-30 TaxID=549789 RepID=A0A1U7IYY7_9CYAN|nr:hypothetical protein NIES30_23745 [Phormidium tenue NIES-30]